VEQPQGTQKRLRGRPWPKGVSGNPEGGRKKPDCLLKILRAALKERKAGSKHTHEEDIARMWLAAVEGGSLQALAMMLDRLYGRPREDVQLSGASGGPILWRITIVESANGGNGNGAPEGAPPGAPPLPEAN